LFLAAIALVTALDLITKELVRRLMFGADFELLGRLLSFTYVENRGAAYGTFFGKQSFLVILTSALLILLLAYAFFTRKRSTRLEMLALALIIGGGAGNLISRVTLGYVVDFINIHIIPVFNVADIAICSGCGLLVLSLFFVKRPEND
jgi:signal peptidase II